MYFIWVDGSGTAYGTAGKYDLQAALIGPGAPSGVTAGVENTALLVQWTAANDPNIEGYNFYCDPPIGYSSDASGLADTFVPPQAEGESTFECPDGTVSPSTVDASDVDGEAGAVVSSTFDAGQCVPINELSSDASTTVGVGSCSSAVLGVGSNSDGGSFVDEAGITHSPGQHPHARYLRFSSVWHRRRREHGQQLSK